MVMKMVIEIPKQLQRRDIKFIRLAPKSKKPIDKGWTTNPDVWYNFDDKELLEHLEKGGNYGILCGEKLLVIDSDSKELTEYIEKNFPKTFTDLTGSNISYKKHFFYYSEDDTSFVLKKINKDGTEKHFGEIQGKGKQVVGANCIHPETKKRYKVLKELNITSLKKEDLEKLKQKFCSKEVLIAKKNKKPAKGFEDDDIESNLNIVNVVDVKKFKKDGLKDYYIGSHPVHGSTTGHNFHIDANENIWYCFRCSSGGGVASLIAITERLINCSEAKTKLTKEKYKDVLEIARIKYDFKVKSGKKKDYEGKGVIIEEESMSWYRKLAKDFIKEFPMFYDKARLWWLWDFENYCWVKVDKVDIMNKFDEKFIMATERQELKSRILEALKKRGRLNIPKEPSKSWIQFKDKIVDIETDEEFEATPKYFITNPVPWKLSESEETPTIDRLIRE